MGETSRQEYRLMKLDETNYIAWRWQFVTIAKQAGLSQLFDPKTFEIAEDLSQRGMALLASALSVENILRVSNAKSFKDAWATLELCYVNKTTYEPQALYRRLYSYSINSATEVSKGLSEMQGIVAQLRNLGEQVTDHCLIGAVLSALPESFRMFISIWKNSPGKTIDDLVAKLMAEANEQVAEQSKSSSAHVAKNRQISRRNQCAYCKKEGHWISDCPTRPHRSNEKLSDKQSGKSFARQFRKQQAKRDDKHNKNQRSSQASDDKESTDPKSLAFTTALNSTEFGRNQWVADSGCTSHMTSFRELFDEVRPSPYQRIMTADRNTSISVMGQGKIQTNHGTLQNVLYVPDLGYNLFSLSAASKCGLTHRGDKDKIVFYHEEKPVFTAWAKCNLFVIDFEPAQIYHHCLGASMEEWHARFVHINRDTIKLMHKNQSVRDLSFAKGKDELCIGCQLNKCTHSPHPSRTTAKAKLPGQVLHVDTAGPAPIPSLSGSRYLILCKDESSNFRQIYFVREKHEITNRVKQFINQAQLDTGNNVLKLCTDNGTEFVNKSLSSFLEDKGIIHEFSTPYTPAQNGFVERDIRTVKEAARTILNNSSLDKKLWAEACCTAVYALNRALTSTNSLKTPFESWYGKKPSVGNLRIFGEIAVIRKPDRQIVGTWDTKGVEAIFVGYTNRSNTYRFLLDNNIIVSCDAKFINKLHNGTSIQTDQSRNDLIVVCDGTNTPQTSENASQPHEIHEIQPSEQPQYAHQEIPIWSPSGRSDDSIYDDAPAERSRPQTVSREPLDIDVRYIPSGVRGENPIPREQAEHLINSNQDQKVNLRSTTGTATFKLKDLVFNQATNRWQNKSTGHFVSRAHLKAIQDAITSRDTCNSAQALTSNHSVKIPSNFDEAMNNDHRNEWEEAINEEMLSLVENEVFEIVKPKEIAQKPVGSRWVFTIKTKPSGEIEKFKARIVAKGFTQRYGVDFSETYCSVVQIMSTRLALNYAARHNLIIKQFDIKTAFLYASLDETIYMQAPDGVGGPNEIWRLKRSLYGLKQSPRMWNQTFSSVLSSLGLHCSKWDNSVFFQLNPIVIVLVYVDDGLIIGTNHETIDHILACLKEKFKMRELSVNVYRGLEIQETKLGIFIHQTAYTRKILESFGMASARGVDNPLAQVSPNSNEKALDPEFPYRSIVGSLAYLADTSRPDICFAVNHLARYMSNPTEYAWSQAKHVLRYLNSTIDLGILYKRGELDKTLTGYGDSDFAGDQSSSKSTTGYVLMTNQAIFHWKTQLQRHVTLSSTEAEVIALCTLAKELSWIRHMMLEFNMITDDPAKLLCDNTSAIKIALSEKGTQRTRHLKAQNAYVKEQVDLEELTIQHVRSEKQLADLTTKIMTTRKFSANRNQIMTSKSLCLFTLALISLAAITQGVNNDKKEILIMIDNPCELLKDDKLVDKEFGSVDNQLIYRRDAHKAYMVKQCHRRFNDELDIVFHELQRCSYSRSKRSFGSVLRTTAKIAAGVTNFVVSQSESDPENMDTLMAQLVPVVRQLTSKFLTSHSSHKDLAIQDELAVSQAGHSHIETLEYLDDKLSLDLLFASYHVMREIITGLSNLWAIEQHCARGKVAVIELAELLGNQSIKDINPETTKLISIKADRATRTIQIIFSADDREMTIDQSTMLMVILIIVISTLSTTLGSIMVYLLLKNKLVPSKSKDIETNKRNLNDDKGDDLEMQDLYAVTVEATKG